MSESENEYDDTEQFVKDEDDKMADQSVASEGADTSGEVKKKYDPKDPLRPRRKKARRACFACQRAHLTCGKPTPATRYSVNSLPCQGGGRGCRGPLATQASRLLSLVCFLPLRVRAARPSRAGLLTAA
jgi:hypothetical protein